MEEGDVIRKLFSNFSYAGNSKDYLSLFQNAIESFLLTPIFKDFKKNFRVMKN